MRLEKQDVQRLLVERFLGNHSLVYAPIHMTEDKLARPMAQFAQHPSITPVVAGMEPRSLTRQNSSLHVKGLIHHTAPAKPDKYKQG